MKNIRDAVELRVEEEQKRERLKSAVESDFQVKVEFKKELEEWVKRKGFNFDFVSSLVNSGQIAHINFKKNSCLLIPYYTVSGQIEAEQCITLDGSPFSFTEKKGEPTDRIFRAGSKPGKNPCFAMFGQSLNDANDIILVANFEDALAGSQTCPNHCWLALGDNKYTGPAKISIIKDYQNKGMDIICAFNNDPEGERTRNKVIGFLKEKTKSIEWGKDDPTKCSLSKLLKDGLSHKIKELINNPVFVNAKGKKNQAAELGDPNKPTIYFGSDQLDCVTKNAIDILRTIPDKFFNQYNIGPVSITNSSHGYSDFLITPLNKQLIRYYLAKYANCFQSKKDGEVAVAIPPTEVCENIKALCQVGDEASFPSLKGIKESPYYYQSQNNKEKKLHATQGYSQESQYFLANNYSQAIPPESPGYINPAEALNLIYELLDGFPFTSQAERANTIGAYLSVLVRLLINGPPPLFLIVADQPGTGKTLLAQTIGWIFLGRDISCMSEGDNYAEWGKILLSALMSSPSILLIDNITKKLDSPDLAMALTSLVFEGRVLGRSEMVKVPISAVFIATANNPRLSSEMARRVIKISLNSGQDRPQDRDPESFVHPNLREWVYEERMNLLKAFLTLIQNWISEGCPRSKKSLGSFEEWSQIIGGILQVNGVDGFLDNLKETFSEFDDEGELLRTFVSSWYHTFGEASVCVADLYNVVMKKEVPMPLGDKGERSQKIILGKYLTRLKNRRVDIITEGPEGETENSGFKIVGDGTISRINQWRLSYCSNKNIASENQ